MSPPWCSSTPACETSRKLCRWYIATPSMQVKKRRPAPLPVLTAAARLCSSFHSHQGKAPRSQGTSDSPRGTRGAAARSNIPTTSVNHVAVLHSQRCRNFHILLLVDQFPDMCFCTVPGKINSPCAVLVQPFQPTFFHSASSFLSPFYYILLEIKDAFIFYQCWNVKVTHVW